MGKSVFYSRVEAKPDVITRLSTTRDGSKGHDWNPVALDDLT
jgi:hypothetical protein